ncbi:cytochrome c oxidase assembly factor Coa1 family protein [Empedobacter falsenii]|uniref:Cytochrome oxidase complex assembly protein 1 n=1 Tax=Empedobacter falsenii TaxID=343874 RepID=A0A376J3F6_9FLAO|nr:cytochrome c oxidase assembly factor Coa1 family protein [Empedobacter falsenii]STE54731.1 Cytochrome oxidase complex assembly protein 1 [Empedobacter falsenii]
MEENQFDNQLLPKESWFKRNWKWVVPVGCLSFVILFFGLLIGGAFWGFSKLTSDSDVTKHAINIINQNPEVQQKLGADVKTNGVFTGNISITNDTGEANISVPIKGTKGSGTAIIVGEKEFDKWNYEKIAVQVDETGEVIEINKVKEEANE